MAEHQVLGWGTQTAPAQRTNGGNESWELLAIDATFDGTGAAGSFVPAVQIISDAGEEVGTFPLAGSIAAGSSAKVTFAPFLRDGVGLTGIFYDFPNTGDYLDITTTDATQPLKIDPAQDLQFDIGGSFVVTTITDMEWLSHGHWRSTIEGFWSNIVTGNMDNQSGGDASYTAQGFLQLEAANVMIFLDSTNLTVYDVNSHPLFRIDQDGSLHGKTGKSLVFDL